MPIVQSFGALQNLTPGPPSWQYSGRSGGSLDVYGASMATYGAIYRTQPNVRTCVDFLARNIAQLGIHAFRRVSETDRTRLPDHDVVKWLGRPNPWTTQFRLIETLVQDYSIYLNAYWLKVRSDALGLVRLPPEQMHVEGNALAPTQFVWTAPNGERRPFDPSEIVYFGGYDPTNPLMGLSPLETLRRILAEEHAAGEYRQALWANAGRIEGVIERPKDAPKWSPTQKQDWRKQWQDAYGSGGSRPGSVAVLEDGMTFKPIAFSARDSEFLAARKLTREECAAAYHIPLPFVGILDHATFSNIREQHKNLYQDTLGPSLEMIQQELERQLLPEADDVKSVYIEFNIADKLKGSFEEQSTSLQVLVGRPIMTANEGRARLNLPSLPDPSYDELAAQQGGPAAAPADDTTEPGATPADKTPADDAEVAAVLTDARTRQVARFSKLPIGERAAAFEVTLDRWQRELGADLTPLVGAEADAIATAANGRTLAEFERAATVARIEALEQRGPVAMRRTFERDPSNGLVLSFVDAPA